MTSPTSPSLVTLVTISRSNAQIPLEPRALPGLTAALTGLVTDSDGRPFYHAVVRVDSDTFGRQATTNERGEYQFDAVPIGDVVAAARMIGYQERTVESAIPEQGSTINFVLSGKPTAPGGTREPSGALQPRIGLP